MTTMRRSLCGPVTCWIFLWTLNLPVASLSLSLRVLPKFFFGVLPWVSMFRRKIDKTQLVDFWPLIDGLASPDGLMSCCCGCVLSFLKFQGLSLHLIWWNQHTVSRLLILISELMSWGLLGMSLAFPFSDIHTKSWGFFTKRFHQAWEFSSFPFKDMNIKMWAGDCSSSGGNCAFMLFQGIFHNSPGVCWRGWLRVDPWWYSDCSTSCPCCHSRE